MVVNWKTGKVENRTVRHLYRTSDKCHVQILASTNDPIKLSHRKTKRDIVKDETKLLEHQTFRKCSVEGLFS
jgi:hypothetical protein